MCIRDRNNTHKTNPSKQIDLNSLLNNKIEEKTEKSISHNSQKISTETISQINSNVNINELKAKQVVAKETINHFKNNLDEAIKNYKPPISKVNIELNPKNLGKVEVSIIQRGNNITLHMNTDQNNVLLFQNHQAEFRQALSNIGFSNIDMNFNSNQEKERRQNQAKKNYKDNKENIDTSDIKIEAKYQYA
jgi:flagellar hook-length control protein FliK